MTHLKINHKHLLYALLILLAILALTQTQPWVVERAGGVAGSFGVRPATHDCLGITYQNGVFPSAEIEFTFIRFHFRYSITADEARPLCVGQDIWYGE